MFLIRSLIGRAVLGVIVLLVAAGAGWYFFIRDDNEAQKAASDVTDEVKAAASAQASATAATATGSASATTAPNAAPSTVGAVTYRLVAGQSSAWYLAPEKLSRLATSSVAKGTTKDVTGEFHLTATGLDPSKPTTFTVKVLTLKSDESLRDRRMHDALETTKFPTATFVATALTGAPEKFTTTETTMQMTGLFELHGVKKEVTWELKVKEVDGILSGLATVKFKYTDFGIRKPEVAGFVTVEDEVTIQVQLFATKV